jgi:pimeloyl-ACP methyl ester carboxylesterase
VHPRLGGSSNNWTPVLPALAGFKIIRPDLPGSAPSPLPANRLSIESYVDSLEALLAALDVESMTPAQALRAATKLGGEIMMREHELGMLRPGYLADIVLVTAVRWRTCPS